jgi:hypothetical protein
MILSVVEFAGRHPETLAMELFSNHCRAVVLFLLAALPHSRLGQGRPTQCAYFLSKRRWFYSVYLLGVVIDVMDSYTKGGWTYILGQGVLGWGYPVVNIPVAVIGFRSRCIRTHTIMGIVSFVWQVVFGFEFSPLLHR